MLDDASTAAETGGGVSCPTEHDSTPGTVSGKIGAAAYWRAIPAGVNPVTVWLRSETLPDIPACPGDGGADARCAVRDAALLARQRENARQIDCVLNGLGFRLSVTAAWYERPYHLLGGQPAPVLLAFNVGLDWSQIERVADNPLVSRIEPPPGAALVTAFIPPVPAECPPDVDIQEATVEAKVTEIASITGKGRQPVVIETVDQGFLPVTVLCEGGDACEATTNSLWERTILNTRQITCVKRRLDQLVAAPSPNVTYFTLVGSPTASPLPPLGQAAGTLKAFGVGLTFEEGRQIARHPYVERLWTSTGIQFEQPVAGCPPDLTTPIPMTVCPVDQTSISEKISDSDRALFSGGGTTPFSVMIMVSGGAHVCPLEACSQNPCPARDAVSSRWQAENLESQRCVRALVHSVGGTSSSEVFTFPNGFAATLNWDQIQAVAAHPHVTLIEANISTLPDAQAISGPAE